MSYDVTRDEERLIVRVGGRLDAQSSPLLADEMRGMLDDVAEIDFDLSELEYISSAGMRVLLASYSSCKNAKGRCGSKTPRTASWRRCRCPGSHRCSPWTIELHGATCLPAMAAARRCRIAKPAPLCRLPHGSAEPQSLKPAP